MVSILPKTKKWKKYKWKKIDIYNEIHTILSFEKTILITIKLIVIRSNAKPKYIYNKLR